ncbi:MAG TPA: LysE family transporter [Ignavibacteriaceae bacterium]|nr:LysE family transporter [Ignavibacteriaceae bacterium]
MVLIIFLKGIITGFVMAVPIGPIGIMCIRRTLTEGRLRGLIIGLGAATADLLYGCIAAFGLTIISNTLVSQRVWIRLAGGVLLLYLGLRTFRKKPTDPKIPINNSGIFRTYLTAFFITLTNPLTIFVFLAIFAALGLGSDLANFSASALVAGVFIGSALWFFLLSSVVTLFRKKLDLEGLGWVNKIAGILIIISGVIVMASLL